MERSDFLRNRGTYQRQKLHLVPFIVKFIKVKRQIEFQGWLETITDYVVDRISPLGIHTSYFSYSVKHLPVGFISRKFKM